MLNTRKAMDYYILRGFRNHQIAVVSNRISIHAYIGDTRGLKMPEAPPPKGTFDLRLYDRSIITDVVLDFAGNGGADGLFISDKFRQALDKVHLPEHYYFQGSLTQKNHVYTNYQYLHIPVPDSYSSFVDLQKTEFYTLGSGTETHNGPLQFTSWREAVLAGVDLSYYKTHYTDQTLLSEPPSFFYLSKQAQQYDLLDIPWRSLGGYIISERLYHLLVEAKLTGIELVELPWVRNA